MGGYARSKCLMGRVPDAELPARLFDQRRQGRVMNVRDAREQVVLDLKIEPADEPTQCPVAAAKIHGRFHLMHGPSVFHSAFAKPRQRKSRILDTMGQLEYDAQRHPLDKRRHRVKK